MKVRVRVFAAVRDILGCRELTMEVPAGITAEGLLNRVAAEYPKASSALGGVRLAVNREYVEAGRLIAENDEIAIIPPVSGGTDLFEITDQPLSLDALVRCIAQESSGAIATFLGTVRALSRGRRVQHLEYDAYPEMATAVMRQIGAEIRERWPVDEIAIQHRTGRLEIGEASVAIAVASPHRREALYACSYAIERLKEIVPIWKKEVWADGAEWIGSTVDEYRELQQEENVKRKA